MDRDRSDIRWRVVSNRLTRCTRGILNQVETVKANVGTLRGACSLDKFGRNLDASLVLLNALNNVTGRELRSFMLKRFPLCK